MFQLPTVEEDLAEQKFPDNHQLYHDNDFKIN